jgi:hypothetical protein
LSCLENSQNRRNKSIHVTQKKNLVKRVKDLEEIPEDDNQNKISIKIKYLNFVSVTPVFHKKAEHMFSPATAFFISNSNSKKKFQMDVAIIKNKLTDGIEKKQTRNPFQSQEFFIILFILMNKNYDNYHEKI